MTMQLLAGKRIQIICYPKKMQIQVVLLLLAEVVAAHKQFS
jgi:hypothetical protein